MAPSHPNKLQALRIPFCLGTSRMDHDKGTHAHTQSTVTIITYQPHSSAMADSHAQKRYMVSIMTHVHMPTHKAYLLTHTHTLQHHRQPVTNRPSHKAKLGQPRPMCRYACITSLTSPCLVRPGLPNLGLVQISYQATHLQISYCASSHQSATVRPATNQLLCIQSPIS